MADDLKKTNQVHIKDFQESNDNINNNESIYKDVESKFGKISINAKELSILLSRERFENNYDVLDEKTIRRYITKLCSMSNGILEPNDFKENGKSYVFKPEYHDILFTILATDYFGSNKNDKYLEHRAVLHGQIVENIDKYMNDLDKNQIKKDPSYLNAIIEAKLIPLIINELICIFNTMYHSDSVVRYQYIIECADRLVGIRRWMNEWNERIKVIKNSYAKDNSQFLDMAQNDEGFFQNDMLDDLMLKILASKLKKETYQYLGEDELLTYISLYLGTKMYDISSCSDNEIKKILEGVEKNISNEEKYQNIMSKLRDVLDKNDYLENKVLDSIDKIIRAEIVAKSSDVGPWDYKQLIRFIEEDLKADKNAITILCVENNNDILTPEFIAELMAIKDRAHLRKPDNK